MKHDTVLITQVLRCCGDFLESAALELSLTICSCCCVSRVAAKSLQVATHSYPRVQSCVPRVSPKETENTIKK